MYFHVNKGFLILTSVLILFVVTECVNDGNKYWGLDEFKELKELKQSSDVQKLEIDFKSDITTDNYKIELFFEEIKFTRYKAFEIKDSILKSLDGFFVEVIDDSSHRLLAERKIDYNMEGHRENFFLEGAILSLPLFSNLSVVSGVSYKIKVTVPPKRYNDESINHSILGAGVSPPGVP